MKRQKTTAKTATTTPTLKRVPTPAKMSRTGVTIEPTPAQVRAAKLAAGIAAASTPAAKKAGPPLSADAALLDGVLAAVSADLKAAGKPTIASVKADTAALRAAGKVPAKDVREGKPVVPVKAPKADKPVSDRPVTNGHCPKCGRFNDPLWPDCENAKACATRIETGKNYIAHVLKGKL